MSKISPHPLPPSPSVGKGKPESSKAPSPCLERGLGVRRNGELFKTSTRLFPKGLFHARLEKLRNYSLNRKVFAKKAMNLVRTKRMNNCISECNEHNRNRPPLQGGDKRGGRFGLRKITFGVITHSSFLYFSGSFGLGIVYPDAP